MDVFTLICLLLALVAFVAAAVGVAARINLVAAGLALAILPHVVAALQIG
jgi:hypothetical protein